MLYTSHNMRDIEEICDRVLFLHNGRLMAEGTPAQMVERFRTQSLEEVFIRIARGEIVGILGANGAGKTTTLQMILGLIRPTSGRIEIFGRDHAQHRIEILSRMNFSSVGVNLPMNLTVSENLWIFAKLYGVKDARRRLDSLLNLLEIDHLRHAITGRLSSGEISRVNLCKALLNRPELLLLDEPTASLDPDIADKVRKILRRVQQEDGVAQMVDAEEVQERIDASPGVFHAVKFGKDP